MLKEVETQILSSTFPYLISIHLYCNHLVIIFHQGNNSVYISSFFPWKMVFSCAKCNMWYETSNFLEKTFFMENDLWKNYFPSSQAIISHLNEVVETDILIRTSNTSTGEIVFFEMEINMCNIYIDILTMHCMIVRTSIIFFFFYIC